MSGFGLQHTAITEKAGEKLRVARQAQSLSLPEIAKKLRIRAEYLSALENDEYDQLPSGLYGRQFLKEYCLFLHIDAKKILPLTPLIDNQISNNPFSQKILQKWKFFIFPKLIRNIIFILFFCACLLYLLIYFRRLIAPPNLILDYPDKNLLISSPNLEIYGRSEPETEIRINNTSIMSGQDGSFRQEIKLKQGLNNLTISAQKKYGRESVIQRQILVENNYEQIQ
jgi:transcriptional regulator with XRE-family HTH domain